MTAIANETELSPRVDIYENDNEVLLIADLPGVSSDSLSVNLDKGALFIEGTAPGARYRRAFVLRQQFESEQIVAKLQNGALHVTLPRKQSAAPRAIPVIEA